MEKLVTAKNGEQFIIRPIRSEDREELKKALLKLSSNSIGQRFFAMKSSFSEKELNYMMKDGKQRHLGLNYKFETQTVICVKLHKKFYVLF